MSISSTTLKKLMDAGLAGEALLDVVESIEADFKPAKKERTSGAIRQERYRMRHNSVTSDVPSDVTASPLSPKEKSPTPPKEITPITQTPPTPKGVPPNFEFDEWYSAFPNKVGRAAAIQSFSKARKRASFEEIMVGVRRYASKRDDRPWCNPTTWLNQDRWLDQPTSGSSPPPQQIDWGARLKVFRENDTWAPGWGPKPGEAGCKAPQ